MPLFIEIQDLDNGDPMPDQVGGAVGLAPSASKSAPKAEEGLQPPGPGPGPGIVVVMNIIRESDSLLIAGPIAATVAGGAWSANVPGGLANDTYTVEAIATSSMETPATDSRSGIHKP